MEKNSPVEIEFVHSAMTMVEYVAHKPGFSYNFQMNFLCSACHFVQVVP